MSLFRILELGVVGELKVGVVVSVERGVKGGWVGEWRVGGGGEGELKVGVVGDGECMKGGCDGTWWL